MESNLAVPGISLPQNGKTFSQRNAGEALKKTLFFACLLSLTALLSGCGKQQTYTQKDLYAMDTVMSFRVYAQDATVSCDGCIAIVQELEQALSVTDPDSALSAINQTGQGQLPESAAQLLARTLELSSRTGGALDPTIYPVVRLWGFSEKNYRVPTQDEIARALDRVGAGHVQLTGTQVTLSDGAQLDFGAVAKGYAGQQCADYLADQNLAASINLGGNAQTVGSKPDGSDWKIGIANPDSPSNALAVLNLRGTNAIVTSGDYQRYFERDGRRYHHIMDPATGAPADSDLRSVTIVAQDGLLADGLSTALFVMGLEKATDFWRRSDDFEAVFVDENKQIFVTQGLADSITDCDFTVIER